MTDKEISRTVKLSMTSATQKTTTLREFCFIELIDTSVDESDHDLAAYYTYYRRLVLSAEQRVGCCGRR